MISLTRNFDTLALNADGPEEDAGEPGETIHVEDGQGGVQRAVDQTAHSSLLQPVACKHRPKGHSLQTTLAELNVNISTLSDTDACLPEFQHKPSDIKLHKT